MPQKIILHEGLGIAGLNKENLKLNLAGLKPGKAKLVLVATKDGKEIARKEIEVVIGENRGVRARTAETTSQEQQQKQKLIDDKNKLISDFIKDYEEGAAFDWAERGWLSENEHSAKLNLFAIRLKNLIDKYKRDSKFAGLVQSLTESSGHVFYKIKEIRKPEVITSLKELKINATASNTLEEVTKACEEYEEKIIEIVTANEKSFAATNSLFEDITRLVYNDFYKNEKTDLSKSEIMQRLREDRFFRFTDEANELFKIFGFEAFYLSKYERAHPNRYEVVGFIEMQNLDLGTIVACAFPGLMRIDNQKATIKPKVIISE